MLRVGGTIADRVGDGPPSVISPLLNEWNPTEAVQGRLCLMVFEEAGLYEITLRSSFFDACLVVRTRTGKVWFEDDDGGVGTQSRLVIGPPGAGAVVVEARALRGGRGDYELSLRAIEREPDRATLLDLELADARRCVEDRRRSLGDGHPSVEKGLTQVARLLFDRRDFQGGRAACEEALALQTRFYGPDSSELAATLGGMAIGAHAGGDLSYARSLYEKARALWVKLQGADGEDVVGVEHNLALLLVDLGEYAAARPLQDRVLAYGETMDGPESPWTAAALNNRGRCLILLGDLVGAQRDLERSLAIREQAPGPDGMNLASTLENLALARRAQGALDDAWALTERALVLVQRAASPSLPSLARGQSGLADLLSIQGDLEGARRLHLTVLTMREMLLGPCHPDVAQSADDLGVVLEKLGDPSGARPWFKRALAIREEALGLGHPDVAATLHNLGAADLIEGDLVRARRNFERALEIREKAGVDGLDVAETLGNLALTLRGLGDPAAALPILERTRDILRQARGLSSAELASAILNLGTLQRDLGDREAARRSYVEARALGEAAPTAGQLVTAYALLNLSVMDQEQGDLTSARRGLETSLALLEGLVGADHPDVARCRGNLASIVAAEGDGEGALVLRRAALAVWERALGTQSSDAIEERIRIASLMADLGRPEEASAWLTRDGESARAHQARLLQGLGEAEACRYLATVRWRMEAIESPSLQAPHSVFACESLLWWKGQVLRASRASRAAFRQHLGEQGRATLENLHGVASKLSSLGSGVPGRASPTRAELEQLTSERGRLERRIAESPAGLSPVPDWYELRAALPDKSALVDVFQHRVYQPGRFEGRRRVETGRWSSPLVTAWITRHDATEPVRVDLGAVESLQDAIASELRQVIVGRGKASFAPVGGEDGALRRLVWDKLAPHLDGILTVFLSPDGVLATLPFEILREDTGRYLVEDRGFVYLTDPSDLTRRSVEPWSAAGPLLAIGGVDYEAAEAPGALPGRPLRPTDEADSSGSLPRGGEWCPKWDHLPASLGEAQAVVDRHQRSFPGSPALLLTDSRATEERLKGEMPRAAALHLATHGFLRPDGLPALDEAAGRLVDRREPAAAFIDPLAERLNGYAPGLLSGVVCAGANAALPAGRDDGYLTAEEVGWLDLSQVEMVVLADCQTALGRAQSGEGLISLRRAFLMAGARTVIASLWVLPDSPTASLMDRFYANLWEKKLGRHAALRAAQLEMIERNRAAFGDARPVTWGAFVLDGDWR